jgi:hypothetical protein
LPTEDLRQKEKKTTKTSITDIARLATGLRPREESLTGASVQSRHDRVAVPLHACQTPGWPSTQAAKGARI